MKLKSLITAAVAAIPLYANLPLPVHHLNTPLPLYRNAGQYPQSIHREIKGASGSDFFLAQKIQATLFGEYIASGSDAIDSRRNFFIFRDSVSYEDLNGEVRIRLDNIPREEEGIFDVGWKHPDEPMSIVYDLEALFVSYDFSPVLTVGVGKQRYNWGPLQLGGLLISDYNQGFWALYQEYRVGNFTLRGIASQLDSYETARIKTNRYLSVARLEYEHPRFTAGLGQAIIYAGEGRSFELPLLFPFVPFHYVQMSIWRDGNDGDNTLGSLDLAVHLCEGAIDIYGEVVFDDIQQRKTDDSKTVQNHIGRMLGVRVNDINGFYGFIEGGIMSSYTYNHTEPTVRYLNENAFVGSPLGPDNSLLWGQAGRSFLDNFSADLNWWIKRQGEKSVDFTYTGVLDTRDDPIPYGVVEREQILWGRTSWMSQYGTLTLSGGYLSYKNRGNVRGESHSKGFFGISYEKGIQISWRD